MSYHARKKYRGNDEDRPPPEAQLLQREVALCCKSNDVGKGLEVYKKAKENGTQISSNIFQSLISLCGGLTTRGSRPGENTPRPTSGDGAGAGGAGVTASGKRKAEGDADDNAAAADEVAGTGADNDIDADDADGADAGTDDAVNADVVDTDVTGGPSAAERREAAFSLYADATAAGVPILEATYSALVRACAPVDAASTDALGVVTAMEAAGFRLKHRTYSPLLALHCRLGELEEAMELYARARDVLGIDATERDHMALLEACAAASPPDAAHAEIALSGLCECDVPPSKAAWPALRAWFSADAAASGVAWDVRETTVDPASGVCAVTGAVMRSIELAAEPRSRLMEQIERLVCDGDRHATQWATFKAWLARKFPAAAAAATAAAAAPATAAGAAVAAPRSVMVLDGANVGYHKNNYAGAPTHVDYNKIDQMLRRCAEDGRQALLILHQRHLDERVVPHDAAPLIRRWRSEGVMYSCAPGNNDDWYWLYAAVWLGGAAQVVSNDEMRDHHFTMLAPRVFQSWKERHQVPFEYGAWDHAAAKREIELREPPPFSVRVQRGCTASAGGGPPPPPPPARAGVWHFPAGYEMAQGAGISTVTVTRVESRDWLCATRSTAP